MNTTFGQRLKHFANAIDIVEQNTFKQVVSIIEEYLSGVLNIQVVRTMVETRSDAGAVALIKHRLDMVETMDFIPLNRKSMDTSGQMPFAYYAGKPLWIVNQKSSRLLDDYNAEYVDLWSGVASIPKYIANGSEGIKTSIIIPIKNGENRIFGVVNFETSDYLEVTELAKKELHRIAETIANLYQLQRTRIVQSRSTDTVIQRLNDALKTGSFPKLTKPAIFLASSIEADDAVIALIKEVLAEYSDKASLIFWKDIFGSGNINQQLLETIASCRYGICYFSHQVSDLSPKYRDNANVVFEAGMFHGRGDNIAGNPSGWLPIREKDSPPSPFDFASERMLLVPRDRNDDVDRENMKMQLRQHVRALLFES